MHRNVRAVLVCLGLAVAVVLTLGGCAVEGKEPMETLEVPGVTLIGDSQVALGPWSELLGRPVDNRGVSGLEIAEVAAFVDQVVAPDADHVVVWAGTNDVIRRGPDSIEADMAELLAAVRAQAPGAQVVVLTVPPLRGDVDGIPRANAALERAAEGADAVVVDVTGALAVPGRMHADGVHLGEAGYEAVGELLVAELDG